MGRPTKFSEAVAEKLLMEMAITRVGLERICKDNKNFPSARTIYRWLRENADFRQDYARAKEDQLQILEDEILEIADNPQIGETVTEKPIVFEGEPVKKRGKVQVLREVKTSDMIEHRKLRMGAAQRHAPDDGGCGLRRQGRHIRSG